MKAEFDELLSADGDKSNREVALELAGAGFPVFPVEVLGEGDCRPRVAWKDKASTDASRVISWWATWPDDAIGLACGGASGVAVLDLDRKKSKDGVAALAALGFDDLAALSPVRVRTPNDGWHLFFKNDSRLRTKADVFAPGIDIRAEGGFAFAPGSLRGGRRYIVEGAPLGSVDLPPWPEALIPVDKPREYASPVPPLDFAPGELEAVLAEIPDSILADGAHDDWTELGMALHHQFAGAEEGRDIWEQVSKRGSGYDRKAPRLIRTKWRSFAPVPGKRPVTMCSVLKWTPVAAQARQDRIHAEEAERFRDELEDLPPIANNNDDLAAFDTKPAPAKASQLRFLTPGDCAAAPSRGYVVKGLLAPGDVACIFGAPGAGKSLISPHLGYMVAQGRQAFGMRTKPGTVFYVAAEDPHGMRGRVSALNLRHGDAVSFKLVEGVSDILVKESPDLLALYQAIKQQKPSLVFIDTLAMAFPGLEENSAEEMGRVVAIARKLASHGSAVALIHHDTKSQGPTPRGHSLLNGALDVALQLFPKDESGIVRGKLTKNRNGSCDRDIAFRIAVETMGFDEDGDPVTFALVDELAPGDAPRKAKLTPSERAALAILLTMQDRQKGKRVPEDEWRTACIDSRSVSAADDRESRRKATKRAFEGLVRKKAIVVADGLVSGGADTGHFDWSAGDSADNPFDDAAS